MYRCPYYVVSDLGCTYVRTTVFQRISCKPLLTLFLLKPVFFKENVRNPISLILGTRFSLILGAR